MQPDQEPEIPKYSHRGAIWLNSITWAIIVAALLWGLTVHDYEVFLPIALILLVTALSTVANLVDCLCLYATGRSRQALLYLIGSIPLAWLCWWACSAFSHFHKIGG